MKIVFCTIHVRRSSQAVSLAAGCLAAALPRSLCNQTTLLDSFPGESADNIVQKILEHDPDSILFPVYVWNRNQVVEIVQLLNQHNDSLYLIGGGPEATGDPHKLINAAPWTALVSGEGEAALPRLLDILAGRAEKIIYPGITWADGCNNTVINMTSEYNLEIAQSPWLTRVIKPTMEGGVLWEVARGCAFSCDYCFDSRGHSGVRQIPAKRLEAELDYFVEQGVNQVWVLDSTFNYPPERGITLLEMIHQKAPQLHYHFEAKADFLDRRTINLLGKLRCSVQIGLQSVREQVLKSIHRPLDLEILAEKVRLLDAEGIIYGFDLIYGLPGDNYSGFRESIDKVLNFSPNHIHIFPLSVLPGTRLADQKDRYSINAQGIPPYELISSDDWTVEEMELCRRLSTAVDLFYNTGRAVAFFPAIRDALQKSPSKLFEEFFQWLLKQPELGYEQLMDTENWSAKDVYRMLQGFITYQLQVTGQAHLISIFLDFLCYHYHYAETLLGEELLPVTGKNELPEHAWETPWHRSKNFRLVPFAYEILDLLEVEGMQLNEIAELFRPVGSVALFMLRDSEVFCESLGEEMLQLLKQSDGLKSPKEIFAGSLSQKTGEELIQFAVSEGLLYHCESNPT